MPTVTLSDDLFQRAQTHAIPLVDNLEDVLSRALDALEAQNGNSPGISRVSSPPPGLPNGGADLVSYVGRVPHGTEIRMTYKGRQYLADVNNGKVVWNGRRYKSLSDAAVAVIRSTGSDRPTENGWRVWQAKDNLGQWTPLVDLRDAWNS